MYKIITNGYCVFVCNVIKWGFSDAGKAEYIAAIVCELISISLRSGE